MAGVPKVNEFFTKMTKVLTDSRSIRIKGRSFLAVVLTPDMPLDEWLVRLDDLAARSAGFFLGRPVVLDVSELEIDRPELKRLIAELSSRNVSIMGIEGGRASLVEPGMPPALKGGKPAADIEVVEKDASQTEATAPQDNAPAAVAEPRPAVPSLVIGDPVRSGQSIMHIEGDITVVGSVSSGAEVIAGGSIHIYGALRGRAMAGSIGNSTARIFCRKFEPELVAIDGIYKMAEDMDPELRGKPVQLWLENEVIMAERLK